MQNNPSIAQQLGKGSKSTPAENRKTQMAGLFQEMSQLLKDVSEASNNDVKDIMEESESSSDYSSDDSSCDSSDSSDQEFKLPIFGQEKECE